MPEVILPVLNEAAAISEVLASLPLGWTPIVVDNGSTDSSTAIARSAGAFVVVEPQRGFGGTSSPGCTRRRPTSSRSWTVTARSTVPIWPASPSR